MAAANLSESKHQAFAKEIKARLNVAELLSRYFKANKSRIALAIGEDNIDDFLEPLAYFIAGYTFDLQQIKALDSKALGIVQVFYVQFMKNENNCYGALCDGVTTEPFDIDAEDVDVPNNTPAVVDTKMSFDAKRSDPLVNQSVSTIMDSLIDSNSGMYRALLQVNDTDFQEATRDFGDDSTADFGMYLLGTGVTVEDVTDFSDDTKRIVMAHLTKYNDGDDQYEGTDALIEGIKTV